MEDWEDEDEPEELTLEEERRQRSRESSARHRARQTQEERDDRLARERESKAQTRSQESKQQHDARLAKVRDGRLKKESTETEEEKVERLRRNRERVAKCRREKKERRQNQPVAPANGTIAAAPVPPVPAAPDAPAVSLLPTGMAPAMEVVPILPPLVLVPTATKVKPVPPPKETAAPVLAPSAAPAAAAPSPPDGPTETRLPFTLIRKEWEDEWYEGRVVSSYWKEGRLLYRVLYSDGNDEDLEESEVRRFAIANQLRLEGTASLAIPQSPALTGRLDTARATLQRGSSKEDCSFVTRGEYDMGTSPIRIGGSDRPITQPLESVDKETFSAVCADSAKRKRDGGELPRTRSIWRCPKVGCGWTTREKSYEAPQCKWCREKTCVPYEEPIRLGREAKQLMDAAQNFQFKADSSIEIDEGLMELGRSWAKKRSAQARHEQLQKDPMVAALVKKKGNKRMTEETPAYDPTSAGLLTDGINCYFCSSSPEDQMAACAPSSDEDSDAAAAKARMEECQERLFELALGCCRECRYHRPENGTPLRNAALQARLRSVLAKEEGQFPTSLSEDELGEEDCSSEEDTDDWRDTAYNMTDENHIRKEQQKTYLGRIVSLYQSTKSKMKDWFASLQAYDNAPETVEEAQSWFLWAFPPKDKSISTVGLLSHADFEDKNWIQRQLATPYRVERKNTQVCLNFDFHNTVHLSMGPCGSEKLVRHLQANGRSQIKTFPADRDHPFVPPLPTVCNLYQQCVPHPVTRANVPLLQVVDEYFDKHISAMVEASMTWSKQDHRDQQCVFGLGFTGQKSTGWSRALCFGPAEPGLVGMNLPEILKPVWADFGWLATSVCMKALLGDDYSDFKPAYEERQKYARFLADYLGLPEERAEDFLAEHMTIAIGHLVAAHTDYLNCTRRGHNWLLTIRKVVDLRDLAEKNPRLREWAKKFGINLAAVGFTFIAYCRSICGAKADLARLGLNIEDPVAKALWSFLDRVIKGETGYKCYLDVDCLLLHNDATKDGSALDFRQELYRAFSKHVPCAARRGKAYPGPMHRRPEGVTKCFYFTTFAHATWKLLVTIPALQTYGSLLQLAVWAATETNGQELYHTIVFKWLCGDYLDGEQSFSEAWEGTKDLYLMASREAFYLDNYNGWVSSLHPRHQMSHWLRTHNRTPALDPLTGEPMVHEKTQKTVWRYFERPDAAEVSRNFVEQISVIVESAVAQAAEPAKVYEMLVGSGIAHVGHLTAMHVIELFALLGILPFHFFYYATVTSKGKYGTTLFIAKHSGLALMEEDEEAGPDIAQTKSQLDAEYRAMFDNAIKVLEQLKFRGEPLFAEQPMCLIHRIENNNVQDDLVFCDADPEDLGRLQLFFQMLGKGDATRVCYYSFQDNRWIDFFEAMGMHPTYTWSTRPTLKSALCIHSGELPQRPHWNELCNVKTG